MKKYYERYWNNELPKDIPFFADHPTWTQEKLDQHTAWVNKWVKVYDKLLDYGCGEGVFSSYVNAIGTDISVKAIELAKEKYPGATFIPLSMLNDKFEAVMLLDVMEHIFDFDELFNTLEKFTTPQARLLITTNEMCLTKMLAIGTLWMDTFFHPYSPHIRYFTRKSLKKLLDYHGYDVIHSERVGSYFGIISKGQFVVAQKRIKHG